MTLKSTHIGLVELASKSLVEENLVVESFDKISNSGVIPLEMLLHNNNQTALLKTILSLDFSTWSNNSSRSTALTSMSKAMFFRCTLNLSNY